MGVLNIPQLQRSDSGEGGQLLSSLAQLLLSSKLQSGREQEKSKLEAAQLEKAALDAESSLPMNKGKSPLMELIQKPQGYDEIPETIQRPVEDLSKTSAPNPDWTRIPRTKEAVAKGNELTLKSMLDPEKPKEYSLPNEVETFLGQAAHKHGSDMTTPSGRTEAWRWFGTPEGSKSYNEWTANRQAINRPRFIGYTSPDGTHTEMVNVNDAGERERAEAKGLVPGMPDKMASGTKQDLSSTRELQAIMKEINELYHGNNKQGRKWVGIYDSALGNLMGRTGINEDPKEQRFRILVNSLMNITGKLRAGSAWTAPEISRLEQELATTSQGEGKFEEALKWAQESSNNKLSSIQGTARDTRTYYAPTGNQPQTAPNGVTPRLPGESIGAYKARTGAK